jgi:5-methylcytosine-specific restriction enzyme subunit McrC
MLGYANGHDAHRTVRKLLGTMTLPPRGAALVDLVGTMLASECEALIQQGLIQRFVEREAGLPYVRGRLLVLDQVRRHPGQITTLECRYEDFDGDVIENQWLAAALERAVVACRTEEVRRRLRVCRAVLSEICDAFSFDIARTDDFDYQRDNAHYRDAHDWANLFLRPRRLARLFAVGPRSFAFLIDMDRAFEQFVARLVTNALVPAGVQVDRQKGDPAVIRWADSGEDYQRIVPDLLLTTALGRTIPVDSKYKLYGDRKIDAGDVYQLFTYAFAYAAPGRAPIAILIFPVEGDAYQSGALEVRSHDTTKDAARVGTLGVPVQAMLGQLERGQEQVMLSGLRQCLMSTWSEGGQLFG